MHNIQTNSETVNERTAIMDKNPLLLGYCRKDITPPFSHNLSGYGDDPVRPCEGILDPVCGTCLALSDTEGTTVLIYGFAACK